MNEPIASAGIKQQLWIWSKLLRVPNLLIVALTQCILYLLVLQPLFRKAGLTPQLQLTELFLLCLTTVFIAAGGYIINDYYDQQIDQVNKPGQRIIGSSIRPSHAIYAYLSLFLAGLALACYLAFTERAWGLIWLYPAAYFLLWAYARHLKKLAFLGNGIVALFCAGVAGILWVAEQSSLDRLKEVQESSYQRAWLIMAAYMFFAFVSTMYREIIKDLEDEKGDRMGNCHTLPIWLGRTAAKAIAALFALSLLIGLVWFLNNPAFQVGWIPWMLAGLLIFVPVLGSLLLLVRADSKSQFHRLSTLGKWIMVSGLVFVFLMW